MRTDVVGAELSLLETIVARRCPDLAGTLDQVGPEKLPADVRLRIRRAIVDEMCEQVPGDRSGDRRALELEELLIHVGGA